jgi:ABC-2 type transport system ATP-binding protein
MLDEPTSALDPVGRKETLNIINTLRGKYTILFSSHILPDIDRVCDRIALIDKGALILEGDIKNIKSQNKNLADKLNVTVFIKNNIMFSNFLSEIRKLDFMDYIDMDYGKINNYNNGEEVKIIFKTFDRQKSGEILPRLFDKYEFQLIRFEFEDADLESIFISATENNGNMQGEAESAESKEAAE